MMSYYDGGRVEIGVPFFLTEAEKTQVELSNIPLCSTSFVYRLNEAANLKRVVCLQAAALERALLRAGILALTDIDGRAVKAPTDRGREVGVVQAQRDRGGRIEHFCQYPYAAQKYILENINTILGNGKEDKPAFSSRTPSSATSKTDLSARTPDKKPNPVSKSFTFCWSCESRIVSRYSFKCDSCGWPICPKCGACRAPAAGGCPESKRGRDRYTGIMKEKNELRSLLLNHGLLTIGVFTDLVSVESHSDMTRFRTSHAREFEQIENLRQARAEEKQEEKDAKLREIALNEKGIYRIVTETPRLITYITATGTKHTVPNRPPVRTKKGYVLIK